MAILTPGTPEFQAVLKRSSSAFASYGQAVDMSQDVGVSVPQFKTQTFAPFEVHHAIVEQNEDVSKIVMHFKHIAVATADRLSRFLYEEVVLKMKPKAAIQAGPSPVSRSQWDFILMHVPAFEVRFLHERLLKLVEAFVAK